MNENEIPSIGETLAKARALQDIYDREVKELCERIGYGNVMASASRLWRDKCDKTALPRGNFVCGPCEASTVKCPHPARDENGHCAWCCGTGWVTQRVLEAMPDLSAPKHRSI